MVIKRAKTQGFCFGVAITVKKAEEAVATRDRVTTLGHMVHSPERVASRREGPAERRVHRRRRWGGAVRSRTRYSDDVFEKAAARGMEVIDATCPMVTKIHVHAEKLKTEGYKIIVVGDPNHPEVKGTLSHVPGAWCISTPEQIDALPRASRVGVVVQSTWSGTGFGEIVRRLSAKYYEVRAVNTICTDTHNRQSEAELLAQRSR